MAIAFDKLRDRWMAEPEFRESYDRVSPEMEIAFAVAEARARAKLSQAQLAEKVGTTQAMVNRWERGSSRPTTKSLERVAKATNSRLHVELVPA